MEAIRETVDGVGGTVTVHLPAGFAARRLEVNVLPALDEGVKPTVARRQPSAALAGTVIHDNLIEPTVPPEVWDALR